VFRHLLPELPGYSGGTDHTAFVSCYCRTIPPFGDEIPANRPVFKFRKRQVNVTCRSLNFNP